MKSPTAPWVVLLIGLLIATVLEAFASAVLRVALFDAHMAVRWLVTLALLAVALWVGRQYYVAVFRRPRLATVVAVAFLILAAFRLLADRIAELPSVLGALLAGSFGLAAAVLFWRFGQSNPSRQWLAPLFGFLVFINLYWNGGPRP